MRPLPIDQSYVLKQLLRLLYTPSPSGYTDRAVHLVCDAGASGVPHKKSRKGKRSGK